MNTCDLRSARLPQPRCSLWRPALAALLGLCLMLQPTSGQNESKSSLQQKLAQKGSVVLRDATLAEWMLAIQSEWSINIVGGEDLQQEKVSGAFTDTPLKDVLNAILLARGYGYQIQNNSLLIMKLDEMGTVKPQSEIAVIPLDYLDPTEAEPTVQLLLSPTGTVQSVPSSKSLVVIDMPDRIVRVREHLKILEENARRIQQQTADQSAQTTTPSSTTVWSGGGEMVRVFDTRFVEADSLKESLESVVGSNGRVSVVKNENRVVVVGNRTGIDAATRLVEQVDVARPQVRITALLYDVNLETMEQFGFNWSHGVKGRVDSAGNPSSLYQTNSSLFPNPTAAPAAAAAAADAAADTAAAATTAASSPATIGGLTTLHYFSRNFDLQSFIRALDETDGARLLARPTIMAYDGNRAEIKIVSEIPVQQLTETSMGGSIGTTEFREAGITLTVTPRIAPDNTVVLDLSPEFSLLAGFSDEGQPIIDTRKTSTRVQMLDGQTLVIGGLLRRSEMETVRGIPGLMHWKHIGLLFRDHDTTITDSELLIFIKAEIVDLGYAGLPREQMAQEVGNHDLEQVFTADYAPFIPPCRDPHCPYHQPRTTYAYGYQHPPGWIHCPIDPWTHHHGIVTDPYIVPDQDEMEPVDEEMIETPPPESNAQPVESSFAPPPVLIDETARRHARQDAFMAIRRLPSVDASVIVAEKPSQIPAPATTLHR